MQGRQIRRWRAILVVGSVLAVTGPAARSDASIGGMIKGLGDIVGGVLTIPVQTLQGTFTGPPIIGTVSGLLSGTFTGVGRTIGGTFQLLGSAADTAIKVAPMVLPFLL